MRRKASVTVTVIVAGEEFWAVGEPEINPVGLIPNPAGRPVAVQLKGGTPVLPCTCSCRLTVSLTALDWLPGSVMLGAAGSGWFIRKVGSLAALNNADVT